LDGMMKGSVCGHGESLSSRIRKHTKPYGVLYRTIKVQELELKSSARHAFALPAKT